MNPDGCCKCFTTQEGFDRIITDIASFMAGRGAVRDCMMGKIPADIDLVVAGEHTMAPVLVRLLGASLVQLSAPHGLYRLVFVEGNQPVHVDVEFINNTDILRRRDFTIDAITLEQMKLMRRSFEDVAGERIWTELSTILRMEHSYKDPTQNVS